VRLYHGTNEPAARRAMAEGLRPRRETKRSNWKATSHPGAVYLTSAYGPFFGVNAIDRRRGLRAPPQGAPRVRFAVLEVETDRLNPFCLVPDEDAVEQTARGHDDLPPGWDMHRRTRHYRDRLMRDYANGKAWETSLRAMGTCAHLGAIPPSAITRVAFVDIVAQRGLVWAAIDAVVAVRAFRFAGSIHAALTAHIFGDPLPTDPLGFDRLGFLDTNRDGIELLNLQPEGVAA
jgi:hypothetical protein